MKRSEARRTGMGDNVKLTHFMILYAAVFVTAAAVVYSAVTELHAVNMSVREIDTALSESADEGARLLSEVMLEGGLSEEETEKAVRERIVEIFASKLTYSADELSRTVLNGEITSVMIKGDEPDDMYVTVVYDGSRINGFRRSFERTAVSCTKTVMADRFYSDGEGYYHSDPECQSLERVTGAYKNPEACAASGLYPCFECVLQGIS